MVETYWNGSITYPLIDRSKLAISGEVELTIKDDGNSVDFDDVLNLNCKNGKYL